MFHSIFFWFLIFSKNRKRLCRTTRDRHILLYSSLRISTLSSLFVWVTAGCPNSWRHLCAALLSESFSIPKQLLSNSICHSFTVLTRDISSWTLEEKLHISTRPWLLCYSLFKYCWKVAHIENMRIVFYWNACLDVCFLNIWCRNIGLDLKTTEKNILVSIGLRHSSETLLVWKKRAVKVPITPKFFFSPN